MRLNYNVVVAMSTVWDESRKRVILPDTVTTILPVATTDVHAMIL